MPIPFASRNLFYEKGKSLLSILSIAASMALILLLMGFREGLYDSLTAYVNNLNVDLLVAQKGTEGLFSSTSTLGRGLHSEIQEAAGAEQGGHILVANTIFTRNGIKTPVLLVGYIPGSAFGSPWSLGEGRLLESNDEILIDTWLAQRSGIHMGDSVEMLGHTYEVVGLTRETSSWMSPYIFMTLDAAEASLGFPDTVSYHLLRLADGTDQKMSAARIRSQVAGVYAITPEEIAEADKGAVANSMETPLKVILLIGIVIGITVMGLTAYTTVVDHMREYGVLKAIGANNRIMTAWVMEEILYRTISGYILGAGLAVLAAQAIMQRWPQFYIVYRSQNFIQAGLLAMIMTCIAALLPLQRLKKIDPLVVFKA